MAVHELLWGEEAHHKAVAALAKPGSGGKFDVIVAADVVYESSINKGAMLQAYEGLFECMWQLSSEDTLILLAYKPRFPTEPLFFSVMDEYFDKQTLRGARLDAVAASSGIRVLRFKKRRG